MDRLREQVQELSEQSARLNSREEFTAWEQRCDEIIEEGRSCAKRPRLSVHDRQSSVAQITRLESLKDSVRQRFVHAGAGYSASASETGLRWCDIDTAFISRIQTGAVINLKHIVPRQFLEDARNIVLDRVRTIMREHENVKVNTVFNGEFVTGDKRADKSFATGNFELFRTSDLCEWYEQRVIEPTLATLEEFQERDSGWALSRILNLTVNINKYNPLHAGCVVEMPREIIKKKAVINVQTKDNACFAWSVVAALRPAKTNANKPFSYPHYTSVLNLKDIVFPMTLNQIKKFERLNDVSINVYTVEQQEPLKILPIRLTDSKTNKHVNLLYLPDPRDDNVGHFAWIKNLSRLVSSQLSKHHGRKYFCDR